jgi:hypothetical protein
MPSIKKNPSPTIQAFKKKEQTRSGLLFFN